MVNTLSKTRPKSKDVDICVKEDQMAIFQILLFFIFPSDNAVLVWKCRMDRRHNT